MTDIARVDGTEIDRQATDHIRRAISAEDKASGFTGHTTNDLVVLQRAKAADNALP